MRDLIDSYLGLIFGSSLVAVILSTYFLFTTLTTESFDTAKFAVLFIFVSLMLILTTVRYAVQNRVHIIKTPFDLPLLLLLAAAIISTIASKSSFVSILGNQGRVHGSLASIVVYILFYFVLTQSLKTRSVRFILNASTFLAALLALLTLLPYFGVTGLPISLTGSSFSTTAILALLIPVVVSQILNFKNLSSMLIQTLIFIVFAITIALTGELSTWVAGGAAFLISFFAFVSYKELYSFKTWIAPRIVAIIAGLVLTAVVTVLSYIPPVGGFKDPLYSAAANYPREITLDFVTSWKVAVSAFRDSPFWGSGPSTFLFDFTSYKPAEFNASKFWNIRFENGFDAYLQVLATLGGIGMLAYLSLTAFFITASWDAFKVKDPLQATLAASGLAAFVVLLMHTSTLPFFIMALIIFASFWVVSQKNSLPFPFSFVSLPSEQLTKIEALPSISLTLAIALVLFGGFFAGKLYLADFHHKNALNAVAQNNGVQAYNELIASEKLNPWNDLYRTDLAQVNFALANSIALAKGPTQASPSGSLTDTDKQNIQVLLQQSINEGRTATTLSPRSAIDWEILAQLYRQIAGVAQNALLFSLDSYGRAIINDPLNPALRVNVGGVYYAVKNYDLAIRFFTDAINLKPDYPNAYYNLSVAYRDKGDLNSAIQAAEQMMPLLNKNSADYKTATSYLNDLKSKAKAASPSEPPAATASGQLQNQNLPKVINLPKPEKIATPEAVKASPSPSPSTQP